MQPWRDAVVQARLAVRGDAHTPRSRFDLTSLRNLHPVASIRTWLGWSSRQALITNYFNHTQTPTSQGWSVRRTQVRDYRGGTLTYDSHNGTDFSVPVGSDVVAAAPGIVRRVSSEFHRGGKKVVIDHGGGLMTSSNHLARVAVVEGQRVARGEHVAWSGYSGIDGLTTFPFGIPHVHYNVWLNGVPVDPFARDGEVSLWRTHNDPRPHDGEAIDEDIDDDVSDDAFDVTAVDAVVASCVDPALRSTLNEIDDVVSRACAVIFHRNTYPTRFTSDARLHQHEHPRRPRLDLPLAAAAWDGAVAIDARPV